MPMGGHSVVFVCWAKYVHLVTLIVCTLLLPLLWFVRLKEPTSGCAVKQHWCGASQQNLDSLETCGRPDASRRQTTCLAGRVDLPCILRYPPCPNLLVEVQFCFHATTRWTGGCSPALSSRLSRNGLGSVGRLRTPFAEP